MLPDLQQRIEAFQSLLLTLNPAQRAAVEHIEGPVLVIAGPGTGKTHILAARVGKILLETDARPQNILCLTFTDAGVAAMRNRLLDMIGPDAHRVPVYTFHTFCNRIIQENTEYFGRSDLEPVTELERIDIVRNMLADQPATHVLREGRKDVFTFEEQLRDLFATMKKERWTPGHVQRTVAEFLRGIPENPDFIYQRNNKYGKKGEPKQAKIRDIQEKMRRLSEAADLYPIYERALEKAGRYEFEDMLLWVLRAFEKNEALLRNYQERYQYFLVDEYQDTNGAQNRLLGQLLDYWPNPNVFIVGDDDQSIFEFQGARLKNLIEFYYKYRAELKTVVLEENYRSTRPILDAAHQLIDRNTQRIIHTLEQPLSKNLRAQNGHTTVVPVVQVYENRLHECTDICARIEALIGSGVPASDIAVLYARHKQATALLQLFEKKGIPYETKRPANILEIPFVMQLREILQYIRDEHSVTFSGDNRLFRLLHARFFKLPSIELARIALALRENEGGHWRSALHDRAFLLKAQVNDPERWMAVAAMLENWITDGLNQPLPALIEQIIRESGLLGYALEQPDKLWWIQAVNSFLDFAKAETLRHPRSHLERFLHLLDSMDDNRLSLDLQRHIRTGDGVQLLTAFAAKGLEFSHVFVIDCTEDSWEPQRKGGPRRFPMPATLTLSEEEDAMEARRRLFYVAMTRAKTGLYLSYSRQSEEGKNLLPARFVHETGITLQAVQPPAEMLETTQVLLLQAPARPLVTLPETYRIDDVLRNYSMSVTGLNRYLRCPLAFYYEDILKIPGVMSEAAAFGLAMHGALQQYFLRMKSGAQPGLNTLQQLFADEMTHLHGFFSKQGYEQRLMLGKEYLRRYYLEQIPAWRRRAVVERRIDRSVFREVPLSGVIDKIEWLDSGAIRIVDYKTGKPDLKKTERPSETQPNGGEYWRQLVFYKILLENARIYPEPVHSGVIAWLEPDKKDVLVNAEIRFDSDDLLFVQDLILTTSENIRQRRFDTGCGQPDCPWCTMHRNNEASLPFSNPEEELDEL